MDEMVGNPLLIAKTKTNSIQSIVLIVSREYITFYGDTINFWPNTATKTYKAVIALTFYVGKGKYLLTNHLHLLKLLSERLTPKMRH